MDFNLITILALSLALVIGGFIGVGLGRRSDTANQIYDRGRAEADKLREQLREAQAKLKANGLQ